MPQPSQIGSNSFRKRRQFRRTDGPQNPLSGSAADLEGMYKVGSVENAIAGVRRIGRQAQNSVIDQQQRAADQQRVFDQDWQNYAQNAPDRNRRDGFSSAPPDRGPVSPLSPEYMAKIQNEQANSDFRLTPGGSQMLDRFSRLGQAAQARNAQEAYGPLTGRDLLDSRARFDAERKGRDRALEIYGIDDPLTGTRRLRTYAEANAERIAGRNAPELVAAREQRAAAQEADRRKRTARRYGLNPLTPQGFAASDPEGYVQQQEALGRGRIARETGESTVNPLRAGMSSGPPRSAQEAQQRANAMVQRATTSPALQALGVVRQKEDGTSAFASVPEIAENVLSRVGADGAAFSDDDLRDVQELVTEMKHQAPGEDIFGGGYATSLLSELTTLNDTPEAREQWKNKVRGKNKAGLFGRMQSWIYGNGGPPNTQGNQISRPSQIWPMQHFMGAE